MSDNTLLPNGINQWMQDELVKRRESALLQVNSLKKTLKVFKKMLKDVDNSLACQHEIEVASGGSLDVAKCKKCRQEWYF